MPTLHSDAPRSRLCILVLATLSVACGPSAGPGTIGAEQDFVVVEAPAASVATYLSTNEEGAAVRGTTGGDAVRAAMDASSTAHEMPMEGDARLALLAEWIGERLGPDGEVPPTEVIEFFARHLGLVEPMPHILVLGQPLASLEEGLTGSLGQFMGRQRYNRWGASLSEQSNLTVAVVVLSWRWVELEPIARRVESGAPIEVRGQITGAHRNPVVVVAQPDGQVRRLPAGSGPGLDVRVPTASAGVHRVEVVARGERGDTVLANFPVYVGQDPPTSVRMGATETEGADVESVRRELIELLAQTRTEAGVGALTEHVGLREVALGHSRDMVANNFIGHASPTTGTAAERVERAGLSSGLVLENIGRGYGAREIHRGLMESPGHRANLINGDVTHIGVGVVAQPEGPRNAFIVTEVFTQMAVRVDLSGAPAELVGQLNRARTARGAPALTLEDHLSEAAQNAANEFFADPSLSQQDTVDDASASLRRFAIAYRRIGGLMAIVVNVSEAGALEPALDPEVRHIGIGVSQGTRPDTGPNAIAVVIVLGWPR